VLYWGTSEWPIDRVEEVQQICVEYNCYKPRVEQPQYNLLYRTRCENEVIPLAKKYGMGLVTFSPLCSGILSGKYDEGVPRGSRFDVNQDIKNWFYNEENLQKVRSMKYIADGLKCSRTQLAIAWAARKREISSIILGATSVAQLEENVEALKIGLSDTILDEIDGIFTQ
jgi:aryl-alcohol dehydrogenase-like predicted oxidoreductase